MYDLNDFGEIQDKKAELDSYILKKTKITGSLSPADSHVKSLIEKRNTLEQQLSNESEVINAPVAGLVSYRVDGLEEILRSRGFWIFECGIVEIFGYKNRCYYFNK